MDTVWTCVDSTDPLFVDKTVYVCRPDWYSGPKTIKMKKAKTSDVKFSKDSEAKLLKILKKIFSGKRFILFITGTFTLLIRSDIKGSKKGKPRGITTFYF